MAHFFISGHTGFKGAWLSILLHSQGHEVSGFSLPESPNSIFARTNLNAIFRNHFIGDIRDYSLLSNALQKSAPDYFIHLAAQSIVEVGYKDPNGTYSSNVIGTLNALNAVRELPSLRSYLVVTSDKVYRPQGNGIWHKENSPLGGQDPYSNSKAIADLLSQEFMSRETVPPGSIARAGNVIGSGDHNQSRLIPGMLIAHGSGREFEVRRPRAVRPWQHVFDCLAGYLLLLYDTEILGPQGALNFGPRTGELHPVSDLIEIAQRTLPGGLRVSQSAHNRLTEISYLAVDSSRARGVLGWKEIFDFTGAVEEALRVPFSASGKTLFKAILDTVTSTPNTPNTGWATREL
jgi:CDP-glucose 4,6-dehydratase